MIYIYLPSILCSKEHSQKGICLSGLFTVSFRGFRRDKCPQGTVPQWHILQPPLCPVLGISLHSTVPPPPPPLQFQRAGPESTPTPLPKARHCQCIAHPPLLHS